MPMMLIGAGRRFLVKRQVRIRYHPADDGLVYSNSSYSGLLDGQPRAARV